MATWYSGCGRLSIVIPARLLVLCPPSGDQEHFVTKALEEEFIKRQVQAWDPATLRNHLAEYGAWDDEELKDHAQNVTRQVWAAINDLKEERHER